MRGLPLVAGSLVMFSSCYSYRAQPRPALPGSLVRVRYDPPQPVAVAFADRDTLRLSGVMSVEGYVLGASGDTVRLAVRRLRTLSEPPGALAASGGTIVVAPGPGRVAETRQLDALRTTVGVVGIAAVGLILLLVAALDSALSGY
jgi:hypothetical protein